MIVIMAVTPVALAVEAEKALPASETLALLTELTGHPQETWMRAGTIRATHIEYRAPRTTDKALVESQVKQELDAYQASGCKPQVSPKLQKMMADAIPFNVRSMWLNEYTMTSTEVVRYDGDRFYWEIAVQSRSDSMQPDESLADNEMVQRFRPEWNGTRVFAWDGSRYVKYNLPINRAVVDTAGRIPRAVNGPLTAGIIPWGQGLLTAENVRSAKSSAVTRQMDGQSQVCLTLQWSAGTQFECVLDSDKDLVPISATTLGPGHTISTKFHNPKLIGDRWVPMAIYEERHDRQDGRLLEYDQWTLEDIDATTPSSAAFVPQYQPGAVIQYTNPGQGPKVFLPEHSSLVDTEAALAERMAVAWTQGALPQNCATMSLGYVARQLGKPIAAKQLARSVDARGRTNVLELQRLAREGGLYSRAVKTDLTGLEGLCPCQTLLYLPNKNHFVVLAGIEGRSIWLVDLTRSRFIYHVPAEAFAEKEWTSGVALLVSSRPIGGGPGRLDVPESAQQALVGGDVGYSCTYLLQYEHWTNCSRVGSLCVGWFRYFWEMYDCDEAPGYECTQELLEYEMASPCVNNPLNYSLCAVTGNWYSYYTLGCGYGPL
jgi:AraC-like DNA-binding protein